MMKSRKAKQIFWRSFTGDKINTDYKSVGNSLSLSVPGVSIRNGSFIRSGSMTKDSTASSVEPIFSVVCSFGWRSCCDT